MIRIKVPMKFCDTLLFVKKCRSPDHQGVLCRCYPLIFAVLSRLTPPWYKNQSAGCKLLHILGVNSLHTLGVNSLHIPVPDLSWLDWEVEVPCDTPTKATTTAGLEPATFGNSPNAYDHWDICYTNTSSWFGNAWVTPTLHKLYTLLLILIFFEDCSICLSASRILKYHLASRHLFIYLFLPISTSHFAFSDLI